MDLWKWLLLHAYLPATAPWRRAHLRRLQKAGQAPVAVLLFHRVADDNAHGWTIATREFTTLMRWLKKHCELVTLDEAQRRVAAPFNARPCVAVTFDDGYAENCHAALPLIMELKIPCTYFVSSHHVMYGLPFEHDTKLGFRFEPNSMADLAELVRGGIEIGAHTRRHANLASLTSREALREEIAGSRDDLEQALGCPVRWLAFPFGQPEHLSAAAAQVAYEAGLAGVCSAYGGFNFPGEDPFHLQRFGADGPALRTWNKLTLDPLKPLHAPRVDLSFDRLPASELLPA